MIPRHAKEPGETHAYDLSQVLQILDRLPLLEKSLVATATLAGLRQGELRGLEGTDYIGTELVITRSIWMSVVNLTGNGPEALAPALPWVGISDPWGWVIIGGATALLLLLLYLQTRTKSEPKKEPKCN